MEITPTEGPHTSSRPAFRPPRDSKAVAAEALPEEAEDGVFPLNSGRQRKKRGLGKMGIISALIIGGLLARAVGGHLLLSLLTTNCRKSLHAAWQQVTPREAPWEVPTLDQYERSLPLSLQLGKQVLAASVQLKEKFVPPVPGQRAEELMKTLARHLSRGGSENLVGMDVTLSNMQAVGSDELDRAPHKFTVTKFLGEGGRSVVVEVKEGDSGKAYAMRLSAFSAAASQPKHVARKLVELMGNVALMQETTAMLQAAGSTSPSEAGEMRGLAMTSSIATIEGVPSVMQFSSSYLLSEVELMERFSGDMLGVFNSINKLPGESKLYAGKRLLLEVLHLKRAGFSHNDLKLQNLFVREDGTFFIGDFGAGTLVGQPLDRLTGVTIQYAEKELAVAAEEDTPGDARPVADERSDLWSLGLCLYSIFTDGKLPYGLDTTDSPGATLKELAERKVNSKTLRRDLMKEGVPLRWQDLIIDLLKVERSERMDACTLVANYADIIYL